MKILLIYASAGAGHRKACQAIYEALKKNPLTSQLDLTIIDALDYTSPFFKSSYVGTYEFAVKYLPSLWGFFYYLFNNKIVYTFVQRLRRLYNGLNSKVLVKFILETKPEVIVFTHFLASEVIANLKREGKFSGKLISVVTDFGLHSFWVSKYIDQYLVASEETKKQLINWGLEEKRIKITGIPILPDFLVYLNRQEILHKLSLKDNLFTVLIGSGGFGAGPVEKVIRILVKLNEPLQVLVVCGTNKKLYKKIKDLQPKLKIFVTVYGFVENMPELMSISDIMVSKSGGLTSSEALAKKLPLIVISPIPGQERGNCKILVKYDAAYEAKKVKAVGVKIREFIKSPDLLKSFKENANRLAKPNSADEIADLIIGDLR